MHDAESVRIARRRGLLCLWLPAVLCFAVVIGASAVVVQNTYITRMYNGARPSRPVVTFEWAGDETVLGVRGWRRNRKIQPQEVQDEFLIQFQKTRMRPIVEIQGTRAGIQLDFPNIERRAALMWMLPILLVVLPYTLCRVLLRVAPVRIPSSHGRRLVRRSVRSLSSLIALIGTVVVCMYLLLLLGTAIWQLVGPLEVVRLPRLPGEFSFREKLDLLSALFVVGLGLCWFLLLSYDRAHVAFPRRWLTRAMLVAASVGGPLGVRWLAS